jgi:hypothetical protein
MTAPIEQPQSVPRCGPSCLFGNQQVWLITIYLRGVGTVHEDGYGPPRDYLCPPREPRTGAVLSIPRIVPAPGPVRSPSQPTGGEPINRRSRCV